MNVLDRFKHIIRILASHDSGCLDSYEPFLGDLIAHLREKASNAKFFLHETWAYDNDSTHPSFSRYRRSQQQKLRRTDYFAEGIRSICRDTYHLDCLYGRYGAACMWAKCICGITLKGNDYIPETEFLPGVKPDQHIVDMIKEMVDDML